jgi:hypothetical protein
LPIIKKTCIVGSAREREPQEDPMPYQMIREEDYPATGLPVYRVYDADEYQDATIARPRPVGEVWGTGVRGVTGQFIPTGVRWQLSRSFEESPLYPAGAYAEAARAMVTAHEGAW